MNSSPSGHGKQSSEHTWSIDSIEEGVVRVEEDGERMLSLSSHLLPSGTAQGQIYRVTRTLGADGVPVVQSIALDPVATAAALEASLKQTAQIAAQSRKGDRGGDVKL